MSYFLRNRVAIDAASKIGGVCLIVFYVAQYSIEVFRTNQRDARIASISYIQRFADSEILDARLSLLKFWDDRADLAELAVGGAISSESFGFAMLSELEKTPETMAQLKRIGYFFDELYYCQSSNICNGELLLQFFCPHAIGNEKTYFSYLRRNESQTFGRDLFTGVRELSDKCLSKKS